MKYTTGSWNTAANLLGFFEYIENTARQLGLEEYSLFGFPFTMSLAYQTKASAKSRFPVVTISPEQDPVQFFSAQQEQIAQLQRGPVYESLEIHQDKDIEFEDVKQISAPGQT